MKFPGILALICAAPLLTGCDFSVPANIKAPVDTEATGDKSAAQQTVGNDRDGDRYDDRYDGRYRNQRADSARDRYNDAPLVDDRYGEETPSVTEAISNEVDEATAGLKQQMIKRVDSLGDRFERTLERGLRKLDEASSEAYEDPDQR